jgi:integrase/recombinase XerD
MERTRRYKKHNLSKTQDMKRKRRKYPNVFFKNELVAVFDAINIPKVMMGAFLAFFCALRLSEVSKLRWVDINLENKRLKVVNGKNHKDGFVPISSICIPILQKWKLMNPDQEYVLPSDEFDSPYFKSDSLYKGFVRALKKANLHIETERVRGGNMQHQYKFHTLRHSRCTHLLNKGVPLQKVQHFMRHDKIDTTMTYTWILDTELNNMVEGVDRQILQQSPAGTPVQKTEDPLDIAKRRLAYGEISAKEYGRIVCAIRGG